MDLANKYSSIFCERNNIRVESSIVTPGKYHLVVYNADVPIEEYAIKFKENEVSIEKKTIEGIEYTTEKDEQAYKFAEMFIDCGYMQIE